MVRPGAFAVTLLVTYALLASAPRPARAGDMDLALSRLRTSGGAVSDCPQSTQRFCPDQELFERLASELAVAMAPPAHAPARSLGPRGLSLGLDMTFTSIEAQQAYWQLGTEGAGGRGAESWNRSPNSSLVWNRVEARKGLPFGFEAGASLGQGLSTSLWALGLALKWSLFEGFRSGLGRLPDVSVQGSVHRSVGSSQASVQLYALDLTLSKPFVIQHTWSLSPFTGVQTLFDHVTSGVIDLTPGGPGSPADPASDASSACKPAPGSNPPACQGQDADVYNDVTFKPVDQTRVRMFLGAQARYQMWLASFSSMFDLIAPSLTAPLHHLQSRSVARQVAFNLAVGIVL